MTNPLTNYERQQDRAVLAFLMSIHPSLATLDEVVIGAAGDPSSWDARDHARSALDRLIASGQVHRHEELVFVSLAAASTYEMEAA